MTPANTQPSRRGQCSAAESPGRADRRRRQAPASPRSRVGCRSGFASWGRCSRRERTPTADKGEAPVPPASSERVITPAGTSRCTPRDVTAVAEARGASSRVEAGPNCRAFADGRGPRRSVELAVRKRWACVLMVLADKCRRPRDLAEGQVRRQRPSRHREAQPSSERGAEDRGGRRTVGVRPRT